jgi:hypothetical protein
MSELPSRNQPQGSKWDRDDGPEQAIVLAAFRAGELKTDAEHREAIDYKAAGRMFFEIIAGHIDAEDNSDAGAARLIIGAGIEDREAGIDDDQ